MLLSHYTRHERRHAAAFLGFIVLMFVLAGIALFGCGCTGNAPPTPVQVRAEFDKAVQIRDGAQATLNDLRAAAATQPADTPIRQQLEKAIDAAQKQLDAVNKYLPAAEALLKSYEQGKPDAGLAGALGAFGPYGALVAVLLPIGWGVLERLKGNKARDAVGFLTNAAEQIVQSVDVAFPEKTPEQKAAMKAVQDHSTQGLVSRLKQDED